MKTRKKKSLERKRTVVVQKKVTENKETTEVKEINSSVENAGNDEFEEKEQKVIAGIHRAVEPDFLELESDLALIAVVGRGMRATRRTSGRIFSALAHANVNVKMIDELNIIIGVRNHDFSVAINAIYDIFVNTMI